MARRNRSTESTTTSTESTEENSVTVTEANEAAVQSDEAAVEATADAVAEEVAESGAPVESAAEAQAEPEIDLTAFNAAVEAAIEGHDNATGTVPEALVGPVTEAYRALPGTKAKNAAKKVVEEAMREGMASMNIGLARAYMVISDNLTAGPAAKAEKAPADPTEALVQRVAGLELARALVTVPEGVADDWEARVADLVASSRAQADSFVAFLADEAEDKTEPEGVPGWVKAAVKLSQGKAAKVGGSAGGGTRSTYEGERRDIGKHIAEAFENVESGKFLSIAQIRAFKSNEYGDNPPSAGAISARLFPKTGKCSLDFVTPDTSTEADEGVKAGNKGARKN
jgi:hypothetical protein